MDRGAERGWKEGTTACKIGGPGVVKVLRPRPVKGGKEEGVSAFRGEGCR